MCDRTFKDYTGLDILGWSEHKTMSELINSVPIVIFLIAYWTCLVMQLWQHDIRDLINANCMCSSYSFVFGCHFLLESHLHCISSEQIVLLVISSCIWLRVVNSTASLLSSASAKVCCVMLLLLKIVLTCHPLQANAWITKCSKTRYTVLFAGTRIR